ncbi:hypothetical protein [Promicromonospora sukumoe]|uniref:Uncharacterized protein n=1 Tax=Promicromonospora sukumoe TaxID=88382 RepID=A0A7W3J929_9MICO|nr:hypothetical protein [Promicromonospora sukumoe]MBA8808533.1 hypothetical protein [Promicromonospora sukumoe]
MPEIIDVVTSLVDLLGRHGNASGAAWLEQRASVLRHGSEHDRLSAVRDLHRIVLGMGGLMDIYLRAGSADEDRRANAELDALAGRLYRLTESTP